MKFLNKFNLIQKYVRHILELSLGVQLPFKYKY